ncbi:hypothetical protein [Enterococcus sp. AZ177]|uniref:hypothetical protein n=1 Tax=unclassified Enterococcus TaxID=2608891 RepID=UPI003D2FF7E6
MIDVYLQQVSDCCSCFECGDEEQKRNAVLTALETWGDSTCGNWIDDHLLKLRIPLSKECGGCCPRTYIVNLTETWVQPETIKVKLRMWTGIKQETKELEFTYDDFTHDLLIDLTKQIDCCNNCSKYELLLEYVVGTDEIPPGLCKWFCSIAKVYMQLNDVECASCGSQDDVAIVEVDGTKDLSATYKRIAISYFSKVIEKYSLCELKSIKDWTVVK